MDGMDRNLSDDTVKLVRYSIVDIQREREGVLHRGEQLVSDSTTGEAFAAWMIAKHTSLHPDRGVGGRGKTLRVSYEVLQRWPKQDRRYNQRKLQALSEIRDAVREISHRRLGKPSPFDDLVGRLERSRDTFERWRQGFKRCAGPLSVDMAKALNELRTTGGAPAPRIEAAELEAAFQEPKRFHRSLLERFTGRALGELRRYLPQAPGAPPKEVKEPPVYSVWGPVVEEGGRLTQGITGSHVTYIAPDSPELRRYLGRERVDLILNAFTSELGLVRWSAFHQEHPGHEEHSGQVRSIGYQLAEGRLLWVEQPVTEDGAAEAEAPFVACIETVEEERGRRTFDVYSVQIELDFDHCRATLVDRW